jgi:hypothetical protein
LKAKLRSWSPITNKKREENNLIKYSMIRRMVSEVENILDGFIPTQETVTNFCKNIVISSKMEKEVAIICLIYIERLLVKSGFGLEL